MRLSGWGRFPVVDTDVSRPRDTLGMTEALSREGTIAHGMGRGYGDCALGTEHTLITQHLNHVISFDDTTGVLVAEAGMTLADVIKCFLPRGWFPAVTPGTKYVTLGGMIAADVHGKNHHRDGSMAACVLWIDVLTPDGHVHRCSPEHEQELFNFTLGGMGLTGVILRASIRLQRVESGWIDQTTVPAANFRDAMAVFERSADHTYSVAWIDCLSRGASLGRSLVMLGEHAPVSALGPAEHADRYAMTVRKKKSVPVDFPRFALNKWSVTAFNTLYYHLGSRQPAQRLVPWDSYFYPLDAILGWNKIYGRKGFVQFQCVLPLAESERGINALLDAISNAGAGSFLAVLKRMGQGRNDGIAFPMEGYTLALDFPATPSNLKLVARLNQLTADHGGRIYLAKDAVMQASQFHNMDARSERLRAFRAQRDLHNRVASIQSRRLEL